MSVVDWVCKKISLESASERLSAITISRQQVLPSKLDACANVTTCCYLDLGPLSSVALVVLIGFFLFFFSASQKVDDLPGVGWSLGQKLQTLGAETCADLQKFSCQALQKEFGPKTGLLLYQYCRGIDDRNLKTERERRSVSAEINYGIRFTKVRKDFV